MGLKPWTMSFKETKSEEILLHELLETKTSPMAFAKDVLIEVLVRGNKAKGGGFEERQSDNQNRGEIEDIFDI